MSIMYVGCRWMDQSGSCPVAEFGIREIELSISANHNTNLLVYSLLHKLKQLYNTMSIFTTNCAALNHRIYRRIVIFMFTSLTQTSRNLNRPNETDHRIRERFSNIKQRANSVQQSTHV
jgi:hypothetical protein